jgi:hypothetical protein
MCNFQDHYLQRSANQKMTTIPRQTDGRDAVRFFDSAALCYKKGVVLQEERQNSVHFGDER